MPPDLKRAIVLKGTLDEKRTQEIPEHQEVREQVTGFPYHCSDSNALDTKPRAAYKIYISYSSAKYRRLLEPNPTGSRGADLLKRNRVGRAPLLLSTSMLAWLVRDPATYPLAWP